MRGLLLFPAPPITCTGSERPCVSARSKGQRPFSDVKAGKARLARCGGPRPGAAVIICSTARGSSPSSGAVPTGRTSETRRRRGHRAVNPHAPVQPLFPASEHGQAPRSSRMVGVARGNSQNGSVGDRRHEAGQTTSPPNEQSIAPGGETVRSRTLALAGHGSAIFLRLTGNASVVSASPPRMRAV